MWTHSASYRQNKTTEKVSDHFNAIIVVSGSVTHEVPDGDQTCIARCHGRTQVQQQTQKPQLHMLIKILLFYYCYTGETLSCFFLYSYRYIYFCMLTMGPRTQGKTHSNSPEGFLNNLLSLGLLLQVLVSKERICQGWKCHHLSHWGRKSCDFPNTIKSHLFTNWAADFWRIAIWHACNYLQMARIISKNPNGWFSSLFLKHHGKCFGHQE